MHDPHQRICARRMLVLRRALPVDDVAQPPGILVQLDLQLAVLVDVNWHAGYRTPELSLLSLSSS